MRVREDAGLFTHANAYDPGGWDHGWVARGHAQPAVARNAQARVNVCGHMHEPMLYHLSGVGKAGLPAASRRACAPPCHRQWLIIPALRPAARRQPGCLLRHLAPRRRRYRRRLDPGFERVPYDEIAADAAPDHRATAPLAERLARRLLGRVR